MTAHDRVTAALADANPVDPAARPSAEDRVQADVIRRRVLSSPARPRSRAVALVPVVSTVVVLAVVALFLVVGGPRHRGASAAGPTQRALILQALPTVEMPVITHAAMARELQIVRGRLADVPGSLRATLAGADRIRVALGRQVSPARRARIVALLAQRAQLSFYDWEANALTPNGRTVASQLVTQNPTALQISQGAGAGPGYPGGGSASLYDAVTLASKQPAAPLSASLSRVGPEYYLFGEPGSAACATATATATAARRATLADGRYCLLAGPTDEASTTARGRAIAHLDAGLPTGVSRTQAAAQGRVLVVPQGTAVIQAANPSVSRAIPFAGATAQFYVLRDSVALTGHDITNPTAGTAPSGVPDVRFDFTGPGAARFQSVTAQLSHRGAQVSRFGQIDEQHFAVVLGGIERQLITVASVDFRQYPDGIVESAGNRGADIVSAMTAGSAKDLATQLRYGALPLTLRVSR